MQLYGEKSVPPSECQLIVSYVVPPRGGIDCVGMVLWAECTSEFYVYKNGVNIGGGRTSAASPTLQLDYSSCPIGLTGNDVLIVMGEHVGELPRVLKACLLINML